MTVLIAIIVTDATDNTPAMFTIERKDGAVFTAKDWDKIEIDGKRSTDT